MPPRAFGKYEVLARLATGGAANIFLARQPGAAGFNKLVCLKTLLPERASDADFVAMFLDEARLAARLNHRNVVQTYEVGRAGTRYAIVMEYLEGASWGRLRRLAERDERKLPLAAGLAFHHYAPKLTGQIARPVGLLANLLLLGVFALVLVREYETLATIRLRGWFGMSLLVAASLAIGWLFGGPCRSRRKALAVTTAVRNAAVALVIVSSNFAQTAAVTAVVAYALVSIFSTFGFALLLAALPESTGEKSNGRRPELAAGDRLLTPLSDSTVRSKTT